MRFTEIQLLEREEAKLAYHKILWLMEFGWLHSPVKVSYYRNALIDCMVVLDEYITGKRSQFRNNPHTQSQIDLLMNDDLLDGLYLSDDGYSRLHIYPLPTIDDDEQYQMALVVTCSDPTEKIERWCHLHAANEYMWRRFTF